jgi:hypothetical protein
MKTYQYWDFQQGIMKKSLMVEIQAESIAIADKQFVEQFNIIPIKTAWIGVSVKN